MSNSGMSHSNMLNEFNWSGMSPVGTQFLLRPVNEDLMRLQAIEFNEQVRRSAYGFEIVNNKLTIFPIPTKILHCGLIMYLNVNVILQLYQGYVDADEFNVIPKTQTEVVEETNQQVVVDKTVNGLNLG